MSVPIKEDFIPLKTKCRPGRLHSKSWIVIHETGNYSVGAGAENHSRYLKNLATQNKTYLSWHYTVDDKKIINHIPDDEISWNAGDGQKNNGGNMSGIAIEICVNPDSNFQKTVDNAAFLTAHLLNKHKLSLSSVKQHFNFNGKNCPKRLREQGLWNDFIKKCQNYLTLH